MLAAISMGFVDQILTRRSSNESLEQEKHIYVVLGGYSKSKQSEANQRDKIQRHIETNTYPRVLNIFIFQKYSRARRSVSVQYLITSPFAEQIDPQAPSDSHMVLHLLLKVEIPKLQCPTPWHLGSWWSFLVHFLHRQGGIFRFHFSFRGFLSLKLAGLDKKSLLIIFASGLSYKYQATKNIATFFGPIFLPTGWKQNPGRSCHQQIHELLRQPATSMRKPGVNTRKYSSKWMVYGHWCRTPPI